MSDDLLAQFRRKPVNGVGVGPDPGEPEGYVAFATKDRVQRLRIRCATALTHAPSYPLLVDVVYDGNFGTHFILVFTTMAVLVRGRNLQRVVFSIETTACDWIQEFDPKIWKQPADLSLPFIESIEVKITPNNSGTTDSVH